MVSMSNANYMPRHALLQEKKNRDGSDRYKRRSMRETIQLGHVGTHFVESARIAPTDVAEWHFMGADYSVPPVGYYDNSKDLYDVLSDIYGEYATARDGLQNFFSRRAQRTPEDANLTPYEATQNDSNDTLSLAA